MSIQHSKLIIKLCFVTLCSCANEPYVNPQYRLFPSYMVIQVVLNPYLTIDCFPLLDSLDDRQIFHILFK